MARTVAVANQKGGVAKTTTVHALGVAVAELGYRVLLVDLDPQACLTYSVGIDPEALDRSLHDALTRRVPGADLVRPVGGSGRLSLLPATIDLAGAEPQLLGVTGREQVLAAALASVLDDHDLVILDCPPSLGVLTINGLTAADAVVVPLQCETLSHRGVGQLLQTIADVREFTNPRLEVLGVVPTMYDGRTRHARQMLDEVRRVYGLSLFEPPVPKSVRFAEAPALGRSILEHAPTSPGAAAYRALAGQLLTRLGLAQ